ncbi:Methyl-CpG-binding domain-containing protein 4 [Vitis vinifera]|uniref:Methyl-CpG-binding domain-containing protein 4 n=1 Tax=Vitis vinifera TaxID=29760 RepID=A0A438F4M8_VITVI|nr:Methyl-CpG-binding domain-containing protein 4 [Vitis vinifera]
MESALSKEIIEWSREDLHGARMQPMEKTKGKKRKSALVRSSIGAYAVQCEACLKWRLIDTEEEYEEIRSRFIEEPFVCSKKADVSCEDPTDIEYDATRTWAADKPNVPKTPKGFQRDLVLRKDFSKMDAYYITPTGKKVRALSEIAAYLSSNPDCKDLSPSDFNFMVPKIMADTIPAHIERKVSTSGSNKKRKKSEKEDE